MHNSHMNEFCWNELATPDANTAKSFYAKLFGWEFTDHHMGDMTYTFIKRNGQEFGGIWQIPTDKKAHIPPHWMGYISVEDAEKTLEEAKRLGATVKMEVTTIENAGRFAVIMDPTGAHIAFWQSLKK